MTARHVDTFSMRCLSQDASGIAENLLGKTHLARHPVAAQLTIDLCHSLLRCLVVLRNRGDLVLTPAEILSHLNLERLEALARHHDIPEEARKGLASYLQRLPNYAGHSALSPTITRRWHISYTMTLTEVLKSEAGR